jgi:septum site-determining protein MinD
MSEKLTDELKGRSVALVSGKGGSGKTIVAAMMMAVLADPNRVRTHRTTPVLIDGDLGTAGLSLYLGLELVKNTTRGLSNILTKPGAYEPSDFYKLLQPIAVEEEAYFLSAGDHRRYRNQLSPSETNQVFRRVIEGLEDPGRIIIVDCRGGIDSESLAMCQAVDDIILIVETDTTSYQASQYLVDILGENELSHKLRGFIINKAFEDPSTIIRSGTALFRTQYLGSIPFDFEAMRDFFSGRLPSSNSLFSTHVDYILSKAYPDIVPFPRGRILAPKEYSEIGLSNPDSLRGGIFVAAIIALIAVQAVLSHRPETLSIHSSSFVATLEIVSISLLGLFGSLNNTRKLIGRVISVYIKALSRALSKT